MLAFLQLSMSTSQTGRQVLQFGKSSRSTSFRVISSNQKLATTPTSAPKATNFMLLSNFLETPRAQLIFMTGYRHYNRLLLPRLYCNHSRPQSPFVPLSRRGLLRNERALGTRMGRYVLSTTGTIGFSTLRTGIWKLDLTAE